MHGWYALTFRLWQHHASIKRFYVASWVFFSGKKRRRGRKTSASCRVFSFPDHSDVTFICFFSSRLTKHSTCYSFNLAYFLKKGESFLFCRETLILLFLFFFSRLLAPTLTLCMVCESACLLVYVTKKKKEKMYLHNRRRTLEDLKAKPPAAPGGFSSSLVGKQFKRLCPNDSAGKHLISLLLNIWILTRFST